jgi:hypothetical protein
VHLEAVLRTVVADLVHEVTHETDTSSPEGFRVGEANIVRTEAFPLIRYANHAVIVLLGEFDGDGTIGVTLVSVTDRVHEGFFHAQARAGFVVPGYIAPIPQGLDRSVEDFRHRFEIARERFFVKSLTQA